ncbi:type III restriction enzyme [Metamycoplasma subdolum]|uniref:Type III restriction enzyme n=1 Tax=Metamycoplasma subdolum TaxID=92407 RepID=A0A3M0A308_9BACT|nr:DEAD/DEAH box helicase family protein [Metamycoplasma subdolum]RMA79027.1 type III restriction enzyme [Metamycoplasma subdolum]WPB50550.1 DEAD/DEAH box helicase family protein [Metamycoplasma subdolum]
MKLTRVQEQAVNEILDEFNFALNVENKKHIIEFQAPTGSGKTFMIANAIHKMIQQNIAKGSTQKLIFVIATLSSAELPYQMEINLNDYKFDIGASYIVERIESPSISKQKNKDSVPSFKAAENKVFILGKSSFGKRKILTEYRIFSDFLSEIKTQNYTLIYIRDEAHHGGEASKNQTFVDYLDKTSIKTEDAKFEYRIQDAAKFIIKMTATPKGNHKLVYIDEKDFENDDVKLLKNHHIPNFNLKEQDEDKIDNETLLKIACKTFNEIKKRYAENNKELANIRPAMLIQVDSEPKDNIEKTAFKNEIQKIISILESYNLSWVKYFSNEKVDSQLRINTSNSKVSLKEISKNDSNIDTILFKIGPATGWNIPRACMLVQLRNVTSKNLSIQTVGRIKRFPNPTYPKELVSEDSISNKYYIYSNIKFPDGYWNRLILKPKFEDVTFVTGKIDVEKINRHFNQTQYIEKIQHIINEGSIINIYNQIKNDYKKYSYLDGETSKIEDKIKVDSKIFNSIELEIYVMDLLRKNSNYFNIKIRKEIESYFVNISNKNNDNEISKTIFWYILFKNYFDQIKLNYKNSIEELENNSNLNLYTLSTTKTLPKVNDYLFNINLKEDDNRNVNLNNVEQYAYEDLKKNPKHFFDSYTEALFAKRIKSFFEDNEASKSRIKVWSKNPVFHGLTLQYFDELKEIKNSYADFVFKINANDIEHNIYIEVKNLYNDYDKEKTRQIIDSYQKYVQASKIEENDLIRSSKKSYTFLICYVDISADDFYFVGASTLENLNNQVFKNPKNSNEIIETKHTFIFKIKDLFDYFK